MNNTVQKNTHLYKLAKIFIYLSIIICLKETAFWLHTVEDKVIWEGDSFN